MAFSLRKKSFRFPVTSQIGSSFNNIIKISSDKSIDKNYKKKFFLTKAVSKILDVPRVFEERHYNRKIENMQIEQPPVFIIGFWRSGTTVLHNLLCQNPDFGYVNTFQAVFPNHCFMNQWWIRNIAQFMLPEKRPGGDMKFDFKLPQEEEIAMGNMQHISFYNFFYYPNELDSSIEKSLYFNNITEGEFEQWKQNYLRLVKIALINTNGTRFISKNPPNTFRIKVLLELFPGAKFIYIHRNSYQSIYSFQRFVNSVHEGIKYQDYNVDNHNEKVIGLYKMMMKKYLSDKSLIPEGQLIDLKFERFEKNMLSEIERIFEILDIPNYEKARPVIEKYHHEIGDYKRVPHQLSDQFKKQVDDILGDLVEE